jgi:hypothetical protein
MDTTRDFGFSINTENGVDTPFAFRNDGLTQELLNSMMRHPGEAQRKASPALPQCPKCGERYCGNGLQLCTECAAPNTEVKQAKEVQS